MATLLPARLSLTLVLVVSLCCPALCSALRPADLVTCPAARLQTVVLDTLVPLTGTEHYLVHGQSLTLQDTAVILMVGTKWLSVSVGEGRDRFRVRLGEATMQLNIITSFDIS